MIPRAMNNASGNNRVRRQANNRNGQRNENGNNSKRNENRSGNRVGNRVRNRNSKKNDHYSFFRKKMNEMRQVALEIAANYSSLKKSRMLLQKSAHWNELLGQFLSRFAEACRNQSWSSRDAEVIKREFVLLLGQLQEKDCSLYYSQDSAKRTECRKSMPLLQEQLSNMFLVIEQMTLQISKLAS